MVKVKRAKKRNSFAEEDDDSKERLLREVGSDAAMVKRFLDTLSDYRQKLSKNAPTQRSISGNLAGATPLPLSLVANASARGFAADDDGVADDPLSQIRFRYRYGLHTAKWKDRVDERRFAKVPVVAVAKLESRASTSVVPPPPQRGFMRSDGTLVIVTINGKLYPPDLELRRTLTATFPNDAKFVKSPKAGPNRSKTEGRSSFSRDERWNDDDVVDDGGYDNDGHLDHVQGAVHGHGARNGADDNGDGDNDDGVSSWDEESDEEVTSPPAGLDVSRVELIGACPYCNLSFVGGNGRVLYSILRRITPGNESEFVEEHIDRCCLRQHTGELVKCTECDKSYQKSARKERIHWRKYHPNVRRVCPFEQCSETILGSDEALAKHLSSAHYWSKSKSKSYVHCARKKSLSGHSNRGKT